MIAVVKPLVPPFLRQPNGTMRGLWAVAMLAASPATGDGIPRRLATSHALPLDKVPEPLRANVEQWRALNPSFSFQYFDDAEQAAFMRDECAAPRCHEAYEKLSSGAGKADLFRVAWMYYKGGWWFDSDLKPGDIADRCDLSSTPRTASGARATSSAASAATGPSSPSRTTRPAPTPRPRPTCPRPCPRPSPTRAATRAPARPAATPTTTSSRATAAAARRGSFVRAVGSNLSTSMLTCTRDAHLWLICAILCARWLGSNPVCSACRTRLLRRAPSPGDCAFILSSSREAVDERSTLFPPFW